MGKGTSVDGLAPITGTVKVAISSYNKELMNILEKGFEEEIRQRMHESGRLVKIRVPGSLELGYALRKLAETIPSPDVLVALGCVIRGETYHFEIVSNQSAAAVQRVGEDLNLPVINGILTCETPEQAQERCRTKGKEFAMSACQMVNLNSEL